MNTADFLLQPVDDDRIALVTDRRNYTYGDLRDGAARLFYELATADVCPGDRVGLLSGNSFFWIAAYLAILKLGAIAVPFPTVLLPNELRKKQDFVHCKVMCVERRYHHRYASALAEDLPLIFDDLVEEIANSFWPPIYINSVNHPGFNIYQDAAYMFTSGTTELPRAVRITHANIQANTNSIIQALKIEPNDRMMVILPLYYCFGTSLLHTHLRVGASLVLSNGFTYPESIIDWMEETGCSSLAGVPSTFQTLLGNASFRQRSLKSLRKIQQAGGKLSNKLIKELMDALPEAQIYIMYGQTEATARLSCLSPSLLGKKLGSIGNGIPGVKLSVVEEGGKAVKPGEVGEIIAEGENLSPGYLNNPEATAEKFVGKRLLTGDLATVDEDGYIYIVDRKSDFIKSNGYRISSQEVEAHILEIPEVLAAAAVGEPDLKLGEAIKVFVTPRTGELLSPEKILSYCRKHMARHMIPKEIIVVDSLPVNANGKVNKNALRITVA
jgi:long-chain acyl-CoA synthetase